MSDSTAETQRNQLLPVHCRACDQAATIAFPIMIELSRCIAIVRTRTCEHCGAGVESLDLVLDGASNA